MTTATRPGAPRTTDWVRSLARALRGDGVAMHYQPIVGLREAEVVGYEALLRFPGHPVRSPAHWVEAAHAHGCGAQLEALAIRMALDARPGLPPNTFLSVNVAPGVLLHPAVREVFLEPDHLGGVVVELTEHSRVEHYGTLAAELDRLRSAGAVIAVDDTGAGYAGLHHLVSVRPEIIKLDRTLVAGIDHDGPRRALVEMFGGFANRFDAWVLAEGVETVAELATLSRIGVPLAQGYLLGRPGEGWAGLSDDARGHLGRLDDHAATGATLRLLAEQVATLVATPDGITADLGPVGPTVLLDEHRRPSGIVGDDGTPCTHRDAVLRLNVDTSLSEAAHRALNRVPEHRFDPLLCIDGTGAFVGLVRMERLVEQLAIATRPTS